MKVLVRMDEVPDVRLHRYAAGLGLVPSPDAALLDLCAKLRGRQAEWQRLWAAVSEESDGSSPEGKALDDYSSFVWPCTHEPEDGEDLPSQLLQHRATTPDGRAAKAAAIVAMDDAYKYLDIEICGRDDDCELYMSALRDCPGDARMPLGLDAHQPGG